MARNITRASRDATFSTDANTVNKNPRRLGIDDNRRSRRSRDGENKRRTETTLASCQFKSSADARSSRRDRSRAIVTSHVTADKNSFPILRHVAGAVAGPNARAETAHGDERLNKVKSPARLNTLLVRTRPIRKIHRSAHMSVVGGYGERESEVRRVETRTYGSPGRVGRRRKPHCRSRCRTVGRVFRANHGDLTCKLRTKRKPFTGNAGWTTRDPSVPERRVTLARLNVDDSPADRPWPNARPPSPLPCPSPCPPFRQPVRTRKSRLICEVQPRNSASERSGVRGAR